jgi:predicted alpha/beta superfamily hydrolase
MLARRGTLPAWHQGRALFVTWGNGAAVAGDFNGWDPNLEGTLQMCGSDLWIADVAVASGRHDYKLVRDGVWFLDPENWAFSYDAFSGNPDGKNSVLNTHDSGLGHLVQPAPELCSTALGNCRRFTTYLPRGYGDPANATRRYPVVFMHDGQNIFDDTDCCFGHTGWEINVTLDAEIAGGEVPETIIVGFDHAGAQRIDEYGTATSEGGLQETFMAFQVDEVQPTAAGYWRLDPDRIYTAGASLGGVIAFRLALAHPEVYAGAASLSGSFWYGKDTGTAVSDVLETTGKVDVALYLDHGGSEAGGEDGYAGSVELRDLLVARGWQRSDSPACTAGADALCYFHDAGASHDELAWKARAWRFLRYLLD